MATAAETRAAIERHAANYNVTLTQQQVDVFTWNVMSGAQQLSEAINDIQTMGAAAHPQQTRAGRQTPPAAPAPAAPPALVDTKAADAATSAVYRNQLRQDGLEELEAFVDQWVVAGLTWPEILARLDDVSSAEGQVVDRLYPERRLVREAGRAPVSISQIRFYRDNASSLFRAAGMPKTFYDQPSDFTGWIVAGVDLEELGERVKIAVDWSYTAPPEVRTQLRDLYGVDEGGLAAYALDKEKGLPALQRMRASAGTAAAAAQARFGALTREEAERLVQLGVTPEGAQQRFGALDQSREILQPLTGQTGAGVSREDQLAAVAGDERALEKIQRNAANQAGAFGGRGGFGAGREGISGLGTAR